MSVHLQELLARPEFPRAGKYDARWIIDNQMGLNPLWLTEWLCERMTLKPGMRVLDLGCGRALSSIFLARELGVQVWATDLWFLATDNLGRIEAAGLSDQVFPLHADARDLPFAGGFFDAIVCIDAYIYFGTDDLYLDYVHRFVRPGGEIGIVVPGFMRAVDGPLPGHLGPFWAQECWTWHTVEWWRRLWQRTGLVEVETADVLPEGWRIWRQWKLARRAAGDDSPGLASDIQVIDADQGRYMGWVRMVGRRSP